MTNVIREKTKPGHDGRRPPLERTYYADASGFAFFVMIYSPDAAMNKKNDVPYKGEKKQNHHFLVRMVNGMLFAASALGKSVIT